MMCSTLARNGSRWLEPSVAMAVEDALLPATLLLFVLLLLACWLLLLFPAFFGHPWWLHPEDPDDFDPSSEAETIATEEPEEEVVFFLEVASSFKNLSSYSRFAINASFSSSSRSSSSKSGLFNTSLRSRRISRSRNQL